MKYTLRGYQQEAVDKAMYEFNHYKHPFILSLSVAAGKSLIIAAIAKELGEPVLVLQPSLELIQQNYAKMQSYDIDDVTIYSASAGIKEIGNCVMATIGSIYKKPELFKHFKRIIIDECLGGDVEVLTTDGWVKFSGYKEGTSVAQWDNGDISFVKPSKLTKRMHTGDAWKVTPRHGKSYIATNGHRHPLISSVTNKITTRTTDDIVFGSNWRLPVSGSGSGRNDDLSPIDRLKIATQADSKLCYHKDTYSLYSITLTKQRKIDAFLELCHKAGITPSRRKSYLINGSVRHSWSYRMPVGTTKVLSNEFSIDMGYDRARQFINEVVRWDGNINKNTGQFYYSSSVKGNTDFVCAIATQAGYSCNQTVQIDNRKETYKDIHRLFMLDTMIKGAQRCKKEKINICEYVYCVTVPSSYFVVRSNGFVFITGNCDIAPLDQKSSMYHKFFKGLGDIKVLGLTATPYRANRYTTIDRYGNMKYNTEFRMLNRLKNHFFKKIVYSKDIGELQDEGYIPKAKYIVSDTDWSALKLNSTGADFTKDSLERFADSKINQVLDILPTLKSHKKVLYFCSSISQARKLSQALASYNIECPVVTADTPKKERAEIIRRYRDGEITHMANVSTLLAGFDVPDIDAIVFLRATLSVRVLYQGIGRGFRLDPNDPNKVLTIYDIAGVTQRFGRIESLKVAGSVGNFTNDFQPNTLVSEVGRIDGKVLSSFKITDSKMKAKLKHIAQLI